MTDDNIPEQLDVTYADAPTLMGQTKPQVWVVQDFDPVTGCGDLVLLATTPEAASIHLATYTGVAVEDVAWQPQHRFDDSQEFYIARIGAEEYHRYAMEVES